MKRDVQKISHDIASSKLFARPGRREVTESDTTQPTATNAPAEAPQAAGPSQSAQASTKGKKKAKQAKTCRISQQQPSESAKTEVDGAQSPNGSTPDELDDGSNAENESIDAKTVQTRATHQARIYALISQCLPDTIQDKAIRRLFNQASNKVSNQLSAEITAANKSVERLQGELERLWERYRNNSTRAQGDKGDRPLTRDELIGIITEALRDDQVKGTEVSSLTKTIRELVPELFTDQSAGLLDPTAYLEHITRFAGLSGSEIVQQSGGIDWMQQRLSEMLKSDIRIMPRP